MNRLAALLLPAVLCAQQTIVSTYDVNGRLVRGHGISRTATDGASSSSHTITNLNGRKVPVQEVEERVISSSPTDSITERTVRRYDANGNPLPLERTRIERKTFQDESEQTITTVTRGDATGRTQISERSTQLIRKLGKDQIVSTMVERPSSTGSLELIEKVDSELRSVGENKTLSSTVVARKDTNGRFREAAKTTSEFHTYEGRTEESIVEYEAAATGTMNFVRQRVIRILQK
ncbi:MAG TPA: hypothetical protein VEQ63_11105, partial [Bryobacteraceae bacterium]|nr:hypothetical protein [Bryobacteraceae bacterium]